MVRCSCAVTPGAVSAGGKNVAESAARVQARRAGSGRSRRDTGQDAPGKPCDLAAKVRAAMRSSSSIKARTSGTENPPVTQRYHLAAR